MIDLNFENNRLLDVVDENDEVVDLKPRHEIHREGLLHREIHVFMFDKNKNIFFQKKGLHKPSAGLFDATVAGHVNKGETYIEAAVRETAEETGITISPSDLLLVNKLKISNLPKDDFGRPVNNFIRSIYIYTKPIQEKMLKKEEGIQGGAFQKFSHDFLLNMTAEEWKTFHRSIPQELPKILDYLKTWTN